MVGKAKWSGTLTLDKSEIFVIFHITSMGDFVPHNIGYCCINNTLNTQGVTTGRTMRKATFQQKGLAYASELALANAKDLVTIFAWNAKHNINVFRMGSGILPWGTEYKFTDLPDHVEIYNTLQVAGIVAKSSGQRITAHPDHFVKLASANPAVVQNSINDLELHSLVFDLMGFSATPYNAINIHVGMNFSEETAQRWVDNYYRLSSNLQSRLVVENDDKENSFSTVQLFTYLHTKLNIPLTFDYFHHQFHPNGLTTQEAAKLAAGTWPDGIAPLFHYSESKNLNENVQGNPRAHADYVFSRIDDFGLTLDIDLEAKAKELALFKYRELV
jgi:UV DNA damage endonuclease